MEKQGIGDAFANQMAVMQGIVREMKEISELPSEVPTDQSTLEKVEFPDGGGMLTYMSDHDYPYRGFPFFEIVEKIDLIKKISRAAVSGLFHSLKQKKYWLFTLIPAIWVVKNFVEVGIYTFYRLVERFKLKSIRYSGAVRELYRAFSVPRNEDLHTQELRLMLRDLVCMILEFDNAYRFRVQDWIEELDQKAVKKNPIKEINRILSIAQSREKTQEIRDTWRLVKLVVSVYLRFDRKLTKMLGDVLASIDISKIRLTVDDKHYCARRKDYTFGWISNPKLPEDKLIIEWDKINQEYEKEKKELLGSHKQVHVELDNLYTEALNKITEPVSESEKQFRTSLMEESLVKLREENILKEQSIINKYKTQEQLSLMEKQFNEREQIRLNQQNELEEFNKKHQEIKNKIKDKYI